LVAGLVVEVRALDDAVVDVVDLLADLPDDAGEIVALAQAASRSVVATPLAIRWARLGLIAVPPLVGPGRRVPARLGPGRLALVVTPRWPPVLGCSWQQPWR
jgi:hypothetical protein